MKSNQNWFPTDVQALKIRTKSLDPPNLEIFIEIILLNKNQRLFRIK